MKVLSITATKNRHHCLERVMGMLINQDTEDDYTILIYNNSKDSQELNLPKLPENLTVTYYHRYLSIEENLPYTTLGSIYNDILKYIEPINPDIITHADDDDMFLPNHISEGIKGFKKAKKLGKLGYKPEKSWYRHSQGIDLLSNTLEPSMFIDYNFLKKIGYYNTTSDQHLKWVNDLPLLVDSEGTPTLIYNWGNDYPTFKTSGDPNNLLNFYNYDNFSKDKGDGIITPLTNKQLQVYYNEIKI